MKKENPKAPNLGVDVDAIMDKINYDQDITSESAQSDYLALVTENLRSNIKKINRNSYWLILCVLIFLLVLYDKDTILAITDSFTKLKDLSLILNIVPIIFAFLFFQNVVLWNSSNDLYSIFDRLSEKMYNLGNLSNTKYVIRPFSLLHQIIHYEYNNKKIKWIFKIPITIIFVFMMLGPVILEIISIIYIAKNNTPNFISITSAVLIGIICLSTILHSIFRSKR